jgi:tetratricopeptide (TPR) repeat protein
VTAGAGPLVEDDWEKQVAELWSAIDAHAPAAFLEKMRALAGERPADDAIALFELASANDSTGHPEDAAPLYRRALSTGLDGIRRRRATIQLASTLRNLGRPEESVDLLTAELTAGSDELDDAVIATLSLALVDVGREREGAALAIGALAKHLKRYNRSMANYAKALLS